MAQRGLIRSLWHRAVKLVGEHRCHSRGQVHRQPITRTIATPAMEKYRVPTSLDTDIVSAYTAQISMHASLIGSVSI